MRLLIDNQIPPALARLIDAELGCEARHVVDVGLRNASDAELWQYASASSYILITKDEDFTDMALSSSSAALIWVRNRELSAGVYIRPVPADVADFVGPA